MSNDQIDLSEVREIVNVYKTAVTEISKWSKIKEDLRTSIVGMMGEAEIALVCGVPALKLSQFPVRRFDSAQFVDDFPELAEKYMKTSTQSRLTVVKDESSS